VGVFSRRARSRLHSARTPGGSGAAAGSSPRADPAASRAHRARAAARLHRGRETSPAQCATAVVSSSRYHVAFTPPTMPDHAPPCHPQPSEAGHARSRCRVPCGRVGSCQTRTTVFDRFQRGTTGHSTRADPGGLGSSWKAQESRERSSREGIPDRFRGAPRHDRRGHSLPTNRRLNVKSACMIDRPF
jgi:hypothetical protein